jgi:hypothetical protein
MKLGSLPRVFASFALCSLAGTFAVSPASAGTVGTLYTFESGYEGWSRSATDSSGSSQGSVSRINLGGSLGEVVWLQGRCCGADEAVDAYISNSFATSQYGSLTLQFQWEGYGTEWSQTPNQLLYVQWRPTGAPGWTTLATYNLYPAGGWDSESLTLFTNIASPYNSIDVRFYTNVNDNNDSAKLNNILLVGAPYAPPGATPIPGALPLFMSGAAMLGGLMYRRKRKAKVAA